MMKNIGKIWKMGCHSKVQRLDALAKLQLLNEGIDQRKWKNAWNCQRNALICWTAAILLKQKKKNNCRLFQTIPCYDSKYLILVSANYTTSSFIVNALWSPVQTWLSHQLSALIIRRQNTRHFLLLWKGWQLFRKIVWCWRFPNQEKRKSSRDCKEKESTVIRFTG